MRTKNFTRFSILLILSLLAHSCQEEIKPLVINEQGHFTLHAQNESDFHISGEEGPKTRSVLQPDGSVFWSPADSISFFIGNGANGGYPLVSNNSSDAAQADFIGKIGNCPQGATCFAIYPYNAKSSCTESSLSTYLPSEQTAVEGTFADDLFISVATSQTDRMNFYHVCGGFKFSVSGEGIRKVVFKNNDGGLLAGRLTIGFDESGRPVVTSITDGTDAITVNAPDGGTFIPGKYYYAILPPTRFTKGITITYHRESEHCVFNSAKDFSVKRAVFSKVYGKDEGLTYWRTVNSYAKFLSGAQILPNGIEKGTITEIHFHINSDKKTNVSPKYESGENLMPIYFELDGTVAHFYTPADCYTASYMGRMFSNFSSIISLDLSTFDTSNVTNMGAMFDGCSSLTTLDLSYFDTSNVDDMQFLFSGCKSLKVVNFSNWENPCLLTIKGMFYGCSSLESMNFSGFNTSNVRDMSMLFQYCKNLKTLDISSLNTSKVTTMSQMFLECSSLTSLDLSHFDTSNVTNMGSMFMRCTQLSSLDISSFNTSKVTVMSQMFLECSSLTSLDLNHFDTSNVTDMSKMFVNCFSLTSLDLSHFDTSNVTDMSNMFSKCGSLRVLNVTSFNTSKVTTLYGMFYECSSLTSLDLSHFDTSNVTDMSFLVGDSPSLESVNLSSFNTEKVQEMAAMFQNCKSLKRIDLSNFITPALRDITQMFYGCTRLRRLILSNLDMSSVNAKNAACYDLASQSKSCKIICSTATKNVLENEATYLGYSSEYIHWYLDGALPESDEDDDEEENLYASTDYSKDGTYSVLQKATQGNGIDIVFIGDAYSDRLIADGTYDATMKRAMEEFFRDEPYKSLRGLFNVYEVYAVSKNETVDGVTALSSWFGEGTHIGGNDGKAMAYANRVPSVTNLDNTLINVIINRRAYAGTAYMYYPSSGDYGCGLSVTYIPLCHSDEEFGNTLRHEAGGHGFAKLADEYWYDENGEISKEERDNMLAMFAYGWDKNIDFTDNLAEIKWSRFVSDSRYSSQGIAAYLGGSTYPFGVWRPTEYSIMRYNTGGYNAPSREAIYYRANKLAYGESWKYDYETFVNFDLTTYLAKVASRAVRTSPDRFHPTHPPVIVKENWRDVLKNNSIRKEVVKRTPPGNLKTIEIKEIDIDIDTSDLWKKE